MRDQPPPRLIPLEGTFNFRDMGGYPTRQRTRTAWGKVYRSDDLNRLTPADLAKLKELGIKTYIDLRDKFETKSSPDRVAPGVKHVHHLPIDTARVMDMFSPDDLTVELAEKHMVAIYESLAGDFIPELRNFFAHLANPDAAPLVFHCMAGKDRTGVAAALYLAALGVERETIYDDYMRSAKHLSGKYDAWAITPAHKVLVGVSRRYLDAAFKVIDRDYGGVDRYLERCMHADLPALRKLYTE